MDKSENIAMSKASIFEQLDCFDFSAPVKVNIIFEDDEDQNAEVIVKEEKTDAEKDRIKKEDSHLEFMRNEDRVINFQPQFDCAANSTNTNCIPIETELEKRDSETSDTSTVIDSNKNLKRKLSRECFSETKSNRITETYNTPDSNGFQHIMQEDMSSVTNQEYSSLNMEMTCISNLLKSVSEHLILILEAYSKYMQIKEKKTTNPTEVENCFTKFRQVKYHFFNLSFCTVENIILPQENNFFFTGKFLKDTVQLAASKHRTVCLETQVAPLFLELLQWSKQKKLAINKIPIGTLHDTQQKQNSPLLRQHLRNLPRPLNTPSKNTAVQMCRTENSSGNSEHQILLSKPRMYTSEEILQKINKLNTQYQSFPPDYVPSEGAGQVGNFNRSVNNKSQTLPAKQINDANRPINTYADHCKAFHSCTLQKNNVISNSNKTKDISYIHQPNQPVDTKNNFVPTDDIHNSKSVVFSSGPPGRQISITVEPLLLQNYSNYSTTSTIAPTQNLNHLNSNQKNPSVQIFPPSYEESVNQTLQYNQRNHCNMDLSQQMVRQNLANNSYLQCDVAPNTTAKPLPPWQQNRTDYSRQLDPQQIKTQSQSLEIQTEQQNLDTSRSISTDSGFMSPLNFNNSLETNKDGLEDFITTPLITHITSLHPEASLIKEGLCYVCKTSTRKMCVGCYQQYYCSYPCQRLDWNMHKVKCKKYP